MPEYEIFYTKKGQELARWIVARSLGAALTEFRRSQSLDTISKVIEHEKGEPDRVVM